MARRCSRKCQDPRDVRQLPTLVMIKLAGTNPGQRCVAGPQCRKGPSHGRCHAAATRHQRLWHSTSCPCVGTAPALKASLQILSSIETRNEAPALAQNINIRWAATGVWMCFDLVCPVASVWLQKESVCKASTALEPVGLRMSFLPRASTPITKGAHSP